MIFDCIKKWILHAGLKTNLLTSRRRKTHVPAVTKQAEVLETRVVPATQNVATLTDLKAAIATDVANSSDDTIFLDADITFTLPTDGIVINDVSGHSLTITGGGHKLDGANLARVLEIDAGNVTLDNLTITNGLVAGNGGSNNFSFGNDGESGGSGLGGGVFNAGNLTLNNSVVSGNKASGGGGAGGAFADRGGGGGGGGFGAGYGGQGGQGHYDGTPTAPSAGVGGTGGYVDSGRPAGGFGGSTVGGSGGSNNGYPNLYGAGGAGGTANNGSISIGGGGGGSGGEFNGGKGGAAVGGVYNTGTLTVLNSSITGNIGAGGGGGGGPGSNYSYNGHAGDGGDGVGAIWNDGGIVQMDVSSFGTLSANTGAGGLGGSAQGLGNDPGSDGAGITNNILTTNGGSTVTNFVATPTVVEVTSSDSNGNYNAGDTITILISFTQNVDVLGTPQLTLETGTTDQVINYVSGTGTSILTFIYTVQDGDNSADLDYTSTTALSLNSGSIKLAGDTVDADLTLPTPGAANSLGASKDLVIDTIAPTLVITSDVSALKKGETATITFTFSEDPGATFTWDGTSGDVVVSGGTLSAISGSGLTRTAIFTPTDNTNGGTASITVASATYTDAAGNDGQAGTTPSVSFDTLAPTLSITSDVSALKKGETATITFTFSEDPGATFTWDGTSGDVVVSGGTLSAISGSGLTRTAIFTPVDDLNGGTASITVAGATYTDAAGNNGGAGTTPSLAFDTQAPTLDITSDMAALRKGETATITFTFSEDPGATFTWDGTTGDVSVSGGTLSAISGTGTTRTAVFTPQDDSFGFGSVTVGPSAYTDAAGNAGAGASTPLLPFDTLAPTLLITSDVPSLKKGETATITFNFSEDPGATFTWDGTSGDVVVSGGTLSAISGSGLSRTATFTPTDNTNGGTASITVGAGSYTDAAGNTGAAGATPSLVFDTQAPTLVISSDVPALKKGETATITFTFSEDPGATFSWDGSTGDVVVSGGTLSAISGTGTTRTAIFTPDDNSSGFASIVVGGATYTDAAGNDGIGAAAPSIEFDTAAPSLVITSDVSALKIGETATITFTFSEDPGATFAWDGTSGDVVVSGGTLSAISGSGLTRTAVFTPTPATNGGVASITVAAGTYTDAAGNAGDAGTTPDLEFDTLAPNAPSTPDLADASDTGTSSTDDLTKSTSPTFTGTAEAGSTVTLYDTDGTTVLGSGIAAAGTWSIPVAAMSSGTHTVTAKATDGFGNVGPASGGLTITIDTTAPSLVITSDKSQLKIGQTATITFTFSEDPGSTFTWDGSSGDVVVSGGTLSAISGSGLTRTAIFTPTASTNGGIASISVPASSYTDAAGNNGGAGTSPEVTFDTLAPATPPAPILSLPSDSGVSNIDNLTNVVTPTILGVAESGAAVTLYDTDGTTVIGSGTATGGTYSIVTSTLSEGAHTITVKATDAAGNVSAASPGLNVTIDTTAPTATIVVADTNLLAGETSLVTITFSEAVANFDNSDLTVSNGVLSAVSSSDGGITWTATFTPNAGVTDSTNVISLNKTGVIDRAGNAGVGSTDSNNFAIDTDRPAGTIVVSDSSLIIGETSAVTITFNRAVTGFTNADLTISNGVLTAVSSSDGGVTWTATFTPNAGVQDSDNLITLDNTGVTDGSGNAGVGSTDSNDFAIDTVRPTASIDVSPTTLAAGASSVVTITFSEAVTNFSNADLTIANGTLTPVSSADGGFTWTATLTATPNLEDATNLLTLDNTTVTDLAGNAGTGTTDSNNYLIDTLRPTATIDVADTQLSVGETTLVTITFTEAITGFTNADLTVANGTLSAVSSSDGGITWTATFTPTANVTDASNVITLDNTGVFDFVDNSGLGTTDSNNYAIDTARPTATIDVADTALAIGQTSLVTITFSEAVTGFTNADLTVVNGTLSAVSSSDGGVTWTATFTPDADLEDTTNVITLDNTGVNDAAGNAGSGTTDSNNFAIDTLRPTAAIDVADTSLIIGETSLVTITFSEPVTGFTNADLSVANGTLSAVSSADGGLTWTATFTPTANLTDTTNVITLDNTGVADAAGNSGSGTTDSNNYAIDTTRPTATIVVADSSLIAGETSLVTITFSEAVTGFTNADLNVENGTLSAVSSSDGGITWTATFTPTVDLEDTDNLITLDNTGVIDLPGNAGSGTTTSNSYAIDTLLPTATIDVADTSLIIGETTVVTITFSEAVTNFDNADLTIQNGTLSPVTSADGGITWTATFTPDADVEDTTNIVTLDNTGINDLPGNAGTGTTDSNNYAIDTRAPTATIVVADNALSIGEISLVTITFSEPVTGLATDDLAVENGTLTNLATADGGLTWTATLTPTADITDTTNVITLDNTGVNDLPGNPGAGTTTSNNYAIDTSAPTATIVVSDIALIAGETSLVTITFSEPVVNFSNADLTVQNGTLSPVTSTDGGITWTATLTPDANIEAGVNTITLDNTGINDLATNPGAGTTLSNEYAIDTKLPTATISVADTSLIIGETSVVTITFSEAITGLATDDFTVVNGVLSGLSTADGGITWTATFTPGADIEDTTNVITLNNAGVNDIPGNAGTGTTDSNNFAIDTHRPTATIVVADSTLTRGETSLVTITFNEPVSGFANDDLTVASGTLSPVSSSDGGITWTATFTPTASIVDTTNVITLDNSGVFDIPGNQGAGTTDSNNYVVHTNDPPTEIDLSANQVDENAANDTVVGLLSAIDPDIEDTFTYTLTNDAGGRFAINGNQLVVADGTLLNYEAATSHDVTVQVQDNFGNTFSQTLTIQVLPVNEFGPVFTSSPTFSVPENTTAVGTVTATDADLPAQTITYSITGGADAAKFSVTSGGVLTFNVAPDFENPTDAGADNAYNVQVTASDGSLTLAQDITVTVTAVNDNSPVFTSPSELSVPENTTAVGNVTATDADLPAQTITYSITGGADAAKFGITAGGTLAFITAPDFESPTDAGADNVYNVTVTADDGNGHTTTQAIAVTVTAVNDLNPVFTTTTFNVDENTTAVGTVIATDGDLPPQTITYSITGGADASKFTITPSGVLTFISAPDYENPADDLTNNIYDLIVTASDGTATTDQAITVHILPVNESAPKFANASPTLTLNENSAVGTVVGTIAATDADLPGDSLTYSITSGNQLGAFAINPVTGQITVADSTKLDFETTPSFSLTVHVTDNGSPTALTADAVVQINLVDLDEGPTITLPRVEADYFLGKENGFVSPDFTFTYGQNAHPDYSNAKLTASITSGLSKKDELRLVTDQFGPTNLKVKGHRVLFHGEEVGKFKQGKKGTGTLEVTFNSAATTGAVQETLRRITFYTTTNPGTNRVVQVQITGIAGVDSNSVVRDIAVIDPQSDRQA